MAVLDSFIFFYNDMCLSIVKGNALLCSQWLRERTTMIRYSTWPVLFLYKAQTTKIQLLSTYQALNKIKTRDVT